MREVSRSRPAPPIATLLLLAALVVTAIWQSGLDAYVDMQVILAFGVVPAHVFGIRIPPAHLDLVPPVATLVTAQFLHGGLWHFLGNLLVFLLIAPLAEGRLGFFRFLAVYLLAGAIGLAAEAAASYSSAVPIVGASAAIAGIMGALARRDPWARARIPLPSLRTGLRWLALPALPVIAVWLILQVGGIVFGSGDAIAFLAHGAGFVAGVLLAGGPRRRLKVVDRWGQAP